MKKFNRWLFMFSYCLITVGLLIAVIKGQAGNPRDKKVGSSFESSGSTSRYALVEAIVEDKTFFFNEDLARFSAPDIVEYNDQFFSIFTPGVSFFSLPFYVLGKFIGQPQLATFLSTMLLAVVNLILIVILVRKLGAGLYSALLAGFIFLFGTNAFSYSLTLTQHHLSVALILLALLNIFGKRTWLKNIWFGAIYGAGILVDIPNAIMMAPIGIYLIFQHYQKTTKLNIVGLVIGMLPFLALFGWYNHELTGSYTKIGQTIGRSDYFEPTEIREKSRQERARQDLYKPKFPFKTRDQLYNLNLLFISNERSWAYYSPIVLVGFIGLVLIYRNRRKRYLATVAAAVVFTDVVIYSMFGAEGGWAFGPRYLIPAAAILSAAIGVSLGKYRRHLWFIFIFLVLTAYSLGVNIIGAMTTTQIPPKVEAVNLANPIPYTYEYNLQLIEKNFTSSLIYNLYLSKILSVKEFIYIYYTLALATIVSLYLLVFMEKNNDKD